MLQIVEHSGSRDCGGMTRRDFLQIGATGALGGSLASLALAADSRHDCWTGKSVVLLFLCGGASHIETFDPKLSAPIEYRSVTGALATSLPGVAFGGTFPELARRADQMAIVRSFAPHGISDHAKAIKHVLTSGDPDSNSVGSRFARLRGASDSTSGLPSYASLIETDEVDPQYMEDRDRMNIGAQSGSLGQSYSPFTPTAGGPLVDDMQLRVAGDRLLERRELLNALDHWTRQQESRGGSEVLAGSQHFQRQAFETILGGNVRQALDVKRESPGTLARYDTSMFDVGWLRKRPCTLGHRLLLARRLCEAGCGFVTVGFPGWDNHANANHPNVHDGMELLGRPLDKAVAAFLDDVRERGLSEKILLIITSEFGRTPQIGHNGGRDHWPGLCPLVFAGGGLAMGQVIGASTPRCEVPATEPIGYGAFLGTLWHTLFDVGQLRLQPSLPPSLQRELSSVEPLPQLLDRA